MKIYKRNEYPDKTLIVKGLDAVDYFDSYAIQRESNCSIDEIIAKMFKLPYWVKILMKIRHYSIVKPFGLSSGEQDAPILFRTEDEIVIGENDKHLNYRVSVFKQTGQNPEIVLTTLVRFNNQMGRMYFSLIKPFHKMVVMSMLKKV